MKTKLCSGVQCLLVLLFICISLLMFSCRKTDNIPITGPSVTERFFELPADANPAVKRIVADLKEKNAKHPFVEEFVKKEGYPLWKHTRFSQRNPGLPSKDNVDGTDTLVSIPVVPDTAKFVKDILRVKLNDVILYKLYKSEEYASYGFDTDPARTSPNANDIAGLVMGFEKDIWGQASFEVTDNRLFDSWGTTPKPDKFYVSAKFTTYLIEIYYVCGWTTGGYLEGCESTEEHCFELIPIICMDSGTSVTWEPDDEGGDGTWASTPGTNGGSSGSGGTTTNPNGQTNPPNQLPSMCNSGRGWVRIIRDPVTGVWKNPCTETPVPIPPDCTYSDEQGQAMLDGSNGTSSADPTSMTWTYGASTIDANGIERKPVVIQWGYYEFTSYTGAVLTCYQNFGGIVYRENSADPWKWESLEKTTSGTSGDIFPCFSMTITPSVSPIVFSPDRKKATITLSATGNVEILCLSGVRIKSIDVPPLTVNYIATP